MLGVNVGIGKILVLSFGEMAAQAVAPNNSRKLSQSVVAIFITKGHALVQFLRTDIKYFQQRMLAARRTVNSAVLY